MRAFIAIEIPDELKKNIAEFQAELKKLGLIANWTSNYHLTLKFLGEINNKKAAEISGTLNEICKNTKKFELELKGLGAFPSKDYVRVLWISAGTGDKEAKALQKDIDNALSNIGFEKEESYTNHITIARVGAVKNKILLKEFFENHSNKSFGAFTVDKLNIIKSTLTPKGPVYETLGEFKF